MRGRLAVVAGVFASAASAGAQELQKKQPPPEFSSGYFPPSPLTPNPRADVFALVDVAVLVVVLSLAAWLVHARRSRRDLRVLVVFAVLYFGFYRLGCICSVGSIQNVALAVGHNGYRLPQSAALMFVVPLVFALFFGRVFCGAACPLGAIQEVILLRPVRVPVWLQHVLGTVPYLYLGLGAMYATTGTAFIICQYDPFVGFYRLGGKAGLLAAGAGLLALGAVVGRPYCRFLCPYGVLLRWMSAFTRWPVRITPKDCLVCHLCVDACPYGAILVPTPERSVGGRFEGRARLAAAVLTLPILVCTFAWLGWRSGPVLARADRRVQLADRLYREERGLVKGTTDDTTAYRNLGKPNRAAYADAADLQGRFRPSGALLGVWCGLVVGGKIVSLSVRRRRKGYEPDQASCLSCARCYRSCPVENERVTGIPWEGRLRRQPEDVQA